MRAAFPSHRVVLAAPAWQEPIATAVGVDEVTPFRGLGPLPGHFRGVDVAVNLHGRGPESSAHLAALGPRRLVAFAHEDVPATAGGPEWNEEEHEVRRWCRMLDAAQVPADPTDLELPPLGGGSPVAAGSRRSRLLFTRSVITSRPSSAMSAAATACAASSVKPPLNAARRRKTMRSSGSSKFSLQAIAARSV